MNRDMDGRDDGGAGAGEQPGGGGEQPGQDTMNLGLLCFIAGRAMEARVLAALAGAGFGDITAAQGRVFARISPGGTRVTELAEQAQVTKQTAGFLIDQLERSGYVTRAPDPVDARARLVTITERGHAVIAAARVAEREVEAEWTRHLGRHQAAQLRRALTRLREITDPYAPDGPGSGKN